MTCQYPDCPGGEAGTHCKPSCWIPARLEQIMISSHIYKYRRQDLARCLGNPEREECKRCARKADATDPPHGWWIGPWVGHNPCPNGDFVEVKDE